jgi:hypothetical protein
MGPSSNWFKAAVSTAHFEQIFHHLIAPNTHDINSAQSVTATAAQQ